MTCVYWEPKSRMRTRECAGVFPGWAGAAGLRGERASTNRGFIWKGKRPELLCKGMRTATWTFSRIITKPTAHDRSGPFITRLPPGSFSDGDGGRRDSVVFARSADDLAAGYFPYPSWTETRTPRSGDRDSD